MNNIETYLLVINLVGFFLTLFNKKLKINILLEIISILGGGLGVSLSLILFNKRKNKEILMSRVFIFSISIIESLIFIMYKLKIFNDISTINFNIFEYFKNHKYFLYYLISINILSFILIFIDKMKAKMNEKRIPNFILLLSFFLGGTILGYLSMKIFHHKIKKDYYKRGIKYIFLMQIIFMILLLNM